MSEPPWAHPWTWAELFAGEPDRNDEPLVNDPDGYVAEDARYLAEGPLEEDDNG